MKILVTGSEGFIGRNLIARLKQQGYMNIMAFDIGTKAEQLDEYAARCDFVFHLAGVNRPQDPREFTSGNEDFTKKLLTALARHGSKAPVLASSSIQAVLDNPYGKSKKAMEDLLRMYGEKMAVPVFLYRLTNVFGKWCRPDYNSAVATFCHRIARGIPITVNDHKTRMELIYIDDLTEAFIGALEGRAVCDGGFYTVPEVYTLELGRIVSLLESFRDSRGDLTVPDLADAFTKKLYSTYLSYLPEDQFGYPLRTHEDSRGSFTEFLRTAGGQISVNVAKPGITKGNHWHHTKIEKFLVVSGEGIIRFRAVGGGEVIAYHADENKPQVVDVPPGYTHSIENTGSKDLVTVIWTNECFDPEKPDTYVLEV